MESIGTVFVLEPFFLLFKAFVLGNFSEVYISFNWILFSSFCNIYKLNNNGNIYSFNKAKGLL
jgi:hypothetical protein